ncbi:hypothetical protein VNO77_22486 [Canavalia gladiata]|uniref:Uncharacterized protein n=1 Tax=Canavalia gladiata TaxID=3824 RepID=A0AAN9L3M8_CANGL
MGLYIPSLFMSMKGTNVLKKVKDMVGEIIEMLSKARKILPILEKVIARTRLSSLILATFSCLSWGIPRSEGAFGFKESEFAFQSPISWWIFDLTHVLENTETGNKPITGTKLDGQLWAMHY